MLSKEVIILLERYGYKPKDMTQPEVKQALDIIIDLTLAESKQILGGGNEILEKSI